MWQARDASTHRMWSATGSRSKSRYEIARAKAQSAIDHARWEVGVPDSMIPLEDEWQGSSTPCREPRCDGNGDFQDLYNRLTAAQGKPVDMSKLPQPTATDADLSAYKAG